MYEADEAAVAAKGQQGKIYVRAQPSRLVTEQSITIALMLAPVHYVLEICNVPRHSLVRRLNRLSCLNIRARCG